MKKLTIKVLRVLLNLPATGPAVYTGRDLSRLYPGTINYELGHGLVKAKLKRKQRVRGQHG